MNRETDELTTREIVAMVRHVQGELDALTKVLYGSMPKGSPEWHVLQHSVQEQDAADREKRRKDIKDHIIKAVIVAVLFVAVQWLWPVVTDAVKKEIVSEVAK